ncbi:MAG: hydrogenase maturation protease [Acidobacteria bacterium]|nr:hydrogenase maturation protease [Acidobacteriota bacterium]
MRGTLVIGIGNRDRSDDAAGLVAARRIRQKHPRDVLVLEQDGHAAALLEAWRDARTVLVVDAASGAGPAGTVRRFDAHRERLPAGLLHASTHSWGIAEAVEMARVLGQLPPTVVVYAVEGSSFGHGRRLTPEVEKAVEDVVRRILEEVSCPSPASP